MIKAKIFFFIPLAIIFFTSHLAAQNSGINYITGMVVNSSGNPASSFWVILNQGQSKIGQSLTGDDGMYYIGNLNEGRYDLVVMTNTVILFKKTLEIIQSTNFNIKLP